MDSRHTTPRLFAFHIAWRVFAILVLALLAARLLIGTDYYASATVLIGLMLLTLFDLGRPGNYAQCNGRTEDL